MEGGEPWAALEKDPLKLTVDDVYEISYDVGCQFRDVSSSQSSRAISELQFKILRVLEMFETLVSKSSISLEELKLERDNLKTKAERLMGELQNGNLRTVGPDKFLINLEDPNCPRFTFQELSDVLQERNNLKAQLLTTRAVIQGYKSGIPTREEHHVVNLKTGPWS
ncbi:RILP-like protein 2 [Pristis pectinata]|uniref:RILP-like protein 2 n=1 Tax=Pristis pectinata TaxID=685728 RepID=UPI00223CC2E3|nr:RILP-like protein 2 [Pristis pectinata]